MLKMKWFHSLVYVVHSRDCMFEPMFPYTCTSVLVRPGSRFKELNLSKPGYINPNSLVGFQAVFKDHLRSREHHINLDSFEIIFHCIISFFV